MKLTSSGRSWAKMISQDKQAREAKHMKKEGGPLKIKRYQFINERSAPTSGSQLINQRLTGRSLAGRQLAKNGRPATRLADRPAGLLATNTQAGSQRQWPTIVPVELTATAATVATRQICLPQWAKLSLFLLVKLPFDRTGPLRWF